MKAECLQSPRCGRVCECLPTQNQTHLCEHRQESMQKRSEAHGNILFVYLRSTNVQQRFLPVVPFISSE